MPSPFPPQSPLHVLVSTCDSSFHSDHPRHHACRVRSTGRYTACSHFLRTSAVLPRAAEYIVHSFLPYNRAAAKDIFIFFVRIHVILLFCVSSLSIPSPGSLSPLTDPYIMDETKKDEVMQVEDTGDKLVCLLTPSAIATCVLLLTFYQAKDAAQAEQDSWLNDKPRALKLRRRMDLRILPLCAWMYVNEGCNPISRSRFRLRT